jgi:hypothetical protein
MSALQHFVRRLIGSEAAAIVAALEYLGRRRTIAAGLIAEIAYYTHLADADINPAVQMLITHNIAAVRGAAILYLLPISPCQIADALRDADASESF